jgi:ATP-dependent protease ClpP protease subunit
MNLSGHVGTAITAAEVRRQLAAAKGGPVDIEIASPGGFLDEAIEIYNALRDHRGTVTARLVGTVASAGTLIACAARRIVAAPSSLWMIHSSSLSTSGNEGDLRHAADVLRRYDDLLVGVYAEKTGKSAETIRADMASERWFNPQEARDYGFVDSVEGSTTATSSTAIATARATVERARAIAHRPGEYDRVAALLGAACASSAPTLEDCRAELARQGYRVPENATAEEILETALAAFEKDQPFRAAWAKMSERERAQYSRAFPGISD